MAALVESELTQRRRPEVVYGRGAWRGIGQGKELTILAFFTSQRVGFPWVACVEGQLSQPRMPKVKDRDDFDVLSRGRATLAHELRDDDAADSMWRLRMGTASIVPRQHGHTALRVVSSLQASQTPCPFAQMVKKAV
eukprot:CAMPEP_0174711484 /NCGR_PEP_ID=MMETSP1094-20130205/12791_1 /TAXON_ID=156173 /ORGANISM="Chrysochromulina brevifilum, Strain UTEX LB 985" /LENGTH=136 /DNA_ID=CAMNT_0015910427 /DNA_START=139 /DNA_END=551 /DNA_ORIENTATION=+